MTLSIRARLTIWYAGLAASIMILLGVGVLIAAGLGMQKAADQELAAGLSGVEGFLLHKLAIHQMDNLNEEFREHSALLPRSKMFRVSREDGEVIYQPDVMMPVPTLAPRDNELRTENILVKGRSHRSASRYARVGPYRFLIQVAVDQTEYHELIEGLAWILVFGTPLAALLASFTGYWMSGRVLAPIHRITETANAIDAQSLCLRLPIRGANDELDRLSSTINRMLNRIAASYERIAQFTSDASHELRTPLALIRSNAEFLLMGQKHSPRIYQGIADILAESIYMTCLVEDLLMLARNGGDHASIPMELLELNEPVRGVLERAEALAESHQITLTCSLLERVIPLRANPIMIERILIALIDNATRYTPGGGEISIETWADDLQCGYTVCDNGIGIEPVHHEQIFERFFRVSGARTPRDGGSGLGLAIARSLVELHQGAIDVESELGSGSRFRVAFFRADLPDRAKHP